MLCRRRHWSPCINLCRPLYGKQSRFNPELAGLSTAERNHHGLQCSNASTSGLACRFTLLHDRLTHPTILHCTSATSVKIFCPILRFLYTKWLMWTCSDGCSLSVHYILRKLSEFDFQSLSGILPCEVLTRVTSIKSHIAHETEIYVENHSASQKD